MTALRHSMRLLKRHPRYFFHLGIKRLQFKARYRWIRVHGTGNRPCPMPLVYKLMLTWKCNLHCSMCMLWGERGWLKEDSVRAGEELSYATVEKIFDGGLPFNASFIFSGGEPLLHSAFGPLLRLLKTRRRFAIVCTNGLRLHRYIEEIEGNPYATFLISLDGPETVNDALRGEGVHGRVMENIQRLQDLKRPPFLAVQFTVMPENVAHMETFCEEMVNLGIDWILINPGWFLSQEQARNYVNCMRDEFGIDAHTQGGYVRQYQYDGEAYRHQLERIRERSWPIQIASHLKNPEWVRDFLEEPEKILDNRHCNKQWLRLDVLPNGRVAPCAQFPDLCVGDLNEKSVSEVWWGEENSRFQERVLHRPLPVCSKCDCLYLYDG